MTERGLEITDQSWSENYVKFGNGEVVVGENLADFVFYFRQQLVGDLIPRKTEAIDFIAENFVDNGQ